MSIYEKVIVKLANTQRKKLKFAVKNKAGITLRITKKALKIKERLMNYF